MELNAVNKRHHTYTRLTAAYTLWMPFIVELIFILKLPEPYLRGGVPVCCIQQGHGFQYENGYSSIDLEPYYVENPDNILVLPDKPSDFIITEASQMPVLDGAEAAYPVYSAFAAACYADIEQIQLDATNSPNKAVDEIIMPIRFTNTVRAYEHLLDGNVDIFFSAKPSQKQQEMATNAGKELVLTPIGKEAFVFFVSNDNPVNNLTSEEIKNVYSGKINNWSKLGGEKGRILAFQRPANSGSQTMMEYFMGDVPLREPLQYELEYSMGGVIREVAEYQNGEAGQTSQRYIT